jgi:hypothetical protein
MKNVLFILAAAVVLYSCGKSNNSNPTVSAFNIINAVNNSQGIIPNFGDSSIVYATHQQVPYASSYLFSPSTGTSPLTLVQATDTSHIFFSGNFKLIPGGIYSLFVSGDTLTGTDTLYSVDNIPYYPVTDSVIGIRFVNLSKASLPMSVNIQGTPTPIANNLTYRQLTAFQTLPAILSVGGSYTFEVRDAVSDSLLTTYTLNFSPLKSQTLVIAGQELVNATVPLNMFSVNNY